jgi:hypothetical protein|tara:strand:+ start:147 stop:572 length:426 start_codon:yes stop_codon:yes gene_type:complete
MDYIKDTLLLATFCKARNVRTTIDLIMDNFELVGNKIFVLQDESDKFKKILTYNIVKGDTLFSNIVKNTISLHRKKDINSLYTLNALNEVIRSQNNGELDEKFSVDWEQYRNTVLVTYKEDDGTNVLRKINTRLISVVNVD